MSAFLTAQQRVQEFDVRHGMDAVYINGWLLFSDGAMREEDPMGALKEPPADSYEQSKLQLQYREEHLKRAVRDFETFKNQITARVNANRQNPRRCYPPDQAEINRLKEMQAEVKKHQKLVEEARNRKEAAKPDWLKQSELEDAESMRRNEEVAALIKDINI